MLQSTLNGYREGGIWIWPNRVVQHETRQLKTAREKSEKLRHDSLYWQESIRDNSSNEKCRLSS